MSTVKYDNTIIKSVFPIDEITEGLTGSLLSKNSKMNDKIYGYDMPSSSAEIHYENDELQDTISTPTSDYCIICVVSYPVSNDAFFKFELQHNVCVNYGVLQYLHKVAYQMTYEIENNTKTQNDTEKVNTSVFLLNRQTTHGKYGIWGHDIEDLIYNGISNIDVYEKCIVCDFGCDS